MSSMPCVRRRIVAGIAGLLFVALSAATLAQTTPRKPLTLVVPAAPGAANDLIARTFAAEIKDELGAVIVENRPGANGTIGAEIVKRAVPDGRTLLVVPSSYAISAAIGAPLPFDFVADFAPVIYAANLPFYLVVNHEAIPAKDVADFVRIVRERSGKISYGSAGNASPHHFAAEMLRLRANLEMTHVPYRGMALGIPDLLEGRIQFVITGLPAVSQSMKGGKLHILATMDPKRTKLQPQVPTFSEVGYAGIEMETWLGVVAPAGTPSPTIDALNAAFNKALEPALVRERLAAQGLEIVGGTPAAFKARIADDIARFANVAKASGIKAE
ncbi:MAG: Bug family tripartite tricarboxylate transporter substrate binding protein [Burkholderiales bacterium]